MKKKIALALVLSMIVTMLLPMTAMAEGTVIIPASENNTDVLNAFKSAVDGDTILLKALRDGSTVYHFNANTTAPAIKSGVTVIVEETVSLYLGNGNAQAWLYIEDGGKLIVNGTIWFATSTSKIVVKSGGEVIFGDNSDFFPPNSKGSGYYIALEGSSTSVPEGFNWGDTRLQNTDGGSGVPIVTPDELNGLTIQDTEPPIVDPTVPTGTDKVNGNTGIEITADPPTLIDPADPYVATIFDAGYIGGSDLWFGTHLASSEPQELPSIDNGEGKGSIISLVTYNQHKVNGIYGIKGQIGIFARNDEAKTPVIEDFSLSLEATTTKWCKDDADFVPKFTTHNITSGFAMGPNEDPLKLFDTDTVGYMLSDYKGVLTLPADAVLATGVATAVMTWTIEAEVI